MCICIYLLGKVRGLHVIEGVGYARVSLLSFAIHKETCRWRKQVIIRLKKSATVLRGEYNLGESN